MKRFLLLTVILASLSVRAQVYNNEWIDYNKTYYKFKIAATNLYRISQATLSGIGLGNTNADHFQLWRNGQEIPLFTTSDNAPLATNGYIEFWGEMNDGKADKPLYRQADFQLNEAWSLQTDTAAFFLTINSNTPNRRLVNTSNNLSGNTLAPEPFFIHTAGNYYKNRIMGGRAELIGTSYVYSSSYDEGEGYTSNDIGTGANITSSFTGLSPYMGGGAPNPFVRVHAAGNAVNPRYFRINLNGDSIHAANMDFYGYAKVAKPVNISQISAGTAAIQIVNRCVNANDRMAVAQVELVYPRTFNFGNQRTFPFTLPANASESYLEITNFNRSTAAPVLYDLTNGRRYVCDISSGALMRVKIQPSATERQLVLVNQIDAWIGAVTQIEQRNFINYAQASNQGDYLIISNNALTGATAGGDPVEDYRLYRSSPQGGGYTARAYMIDQLVDQFAFGIKMHPLSIRNFVSWARATYSAPLRHVLLIGKGVVYSTYRTNQANAAINQLHLVPTFGSPASDFLLTSEQGSSRPFTPIGRLSVVKKEEITDYLNKVKEYESDQAQTSPFMADREWKKNVIHVTGGSDDGTSNILMQALNGQKKIIEDSMYGGKVYTFAKSTADAVQQLTSNELARLLSAGVGVLTYFGHSSASTLEFNLESPENYNNQGKYPIMIVMGCNAGNFFTFNTARLQIQETISEKYVLTKDRGAIAFMAGTHLGVVHYLDIYNTHQYRTLSNTMYGATVGEIMVETIRRMLQQITEGDYTGRAQCEQFTLHGDPAIRYHASDKPDYVVEDQMVEISPKILTIAETDFTVRAKVANIGKAPKREVVVELKRTYPDQTTELIRRDTILFNKLQDSLNYTLPIVATRDKGLNKLTLTIDPENKIEELYETNNSVVKDVYIIEDDLRPAYPYNYSIVNEQNIKFTGSTANPFAVSRTYRMDIDTTEHFNSPWRVSQQVTAMGGIVEFTPSVTFTDSTVYYWRLAPSSYPMDSAYRGFSFQYIQNGSKGFSQAHYFQHKESSTTRMRLDDDRKWRYDTTENSLTIRNGVWGVAITEGAQLAVLVNDILYMENACGFGFVFNIFDGKSFKPWENIAVTPTSGLYNSRYPLCAPSRRWNFEFPNTVLGRQQALNFLQQVPENNIIVLRFVTNASASNHYVNQWKTDAGPNLYDELKLQGFEKIDSIYTHRAFNFVYKKGSFGGFAPQYQYSAETSHPIVLGIDYKIVDSSGVISSPYIGPSKSWKNLVWNGSSLENPSFDSSPVDVYGRTNAGQDVLLLTGLDIADNNYDLSSIDASQYPYLQLKMNAKDTGSHTPNQLRYWMITYDEAPEGAIASNLYFVTRDSVEAGEPFDFGIGFKNISKVDFDSLKVKFSITDSRNVENIIPVPKQKDLAVNDTIKLNVRVDTRSLAGNNTIFVNFNPDDDQPEQYHFNNYAFRSLYVRPDSTNPLLDVTFDGAHILNKDIIAAKPNILIKLKDESRWMVVDDTSAIAVQVRYPDGAIKKYFYYNNSDTMRWVPAGQAPTNSNAASVDFTPYFDQDGEYELIVTGKDMSNNFAGVSEYRVSFQVINKPMISNMLNYPNPFTTSTAFVFTLTGSEIPDNIRIQVMTVTGKIVREITKQELGSLRIGRNVTEFKWDGTDQYGQQLGNGVYLYRVITSMGGKPLDKYKSEGDNTDKYFNKGYGKMYLMR